MTALAACTDPDDGSDAADAIGDPLFEAVAHGHERINPGAYSHHPMPDGACGADGEAWYGRQTWQLRGDQVGRDEVIEAAVAHLRDEGFEVTTLHPSGETDGPRAVEATRGTDGVHLTAATNGATTIVVHVGPCGASTIGVDDDVWVPEPDQPGDAAP